MSDNYIEYIGYLASILVALSFTLKNIKKLRIVNSFGCLAFVAYGFMIGSIPVIITNSLITVINFYYLSKKSDTK